MGERMAHDLAVLLVGTAKSPMFMAKVLGVAEQLHISTPSETLIDALGQPPLGDFMEVAMMELCPGGVNGSSDQQVVVALATLTWMYAIGFVHGALATAAPRTPLQ